jgi:ribosome biogenesis protein ENP2
MSSVAPLKVTTLNDVKVYNCSAGKTVPQWMEDYANNNVGSLRYNSDFRRRIELIQNFDFPTASRQICVSRDGQYIGVGGVYKPQIKVFDTSQLSIKFERHIDSECVQMRFLSDDFSKIAMMRNDRFIEIHASYGRHFQTRVPIFGRDIAYNYSNCDMYIVGNSSGIYRLNLNAGQFYEPYQTRSLLGEEINAVKINPVHQLTTVIGQRGGIECWDPRDDSIAGQLSAASYVDDADLTSLCYGTDGLSLCVGSAEGKIVLFDLRQSKPVLTKDHRNDLPIHQI